MEICKVPALQLKALNKHSITHIWKMLLAINSLFFLPLLVLMFLLAQLFLYCHHCALWLSLGVSTLKILSCYLSVITKDNLHSAAVADPDPLSFGVLLNLILSMSPTVKRWGRGWKRLELGKNWAQHPAIRERSVVGEGLWASTSDPCLMAGCRAQFKCYYPVACWLKLGAY